MTFIQKNMNYYFSLCDRAFKLKSKNNPFTSLLQIQYEKTIRINHTIKNLDSFDIVKIFINYITIYQNSLTYIFWNVNIK